MKEIYIFVYGTLKAGYQNHHFLTDAEFVSDAITCDKYQMYPSITQQFPFLIKSEKYQQIKGKVFKTNSKELLKNLDYLEGYPDLYLKKFIKVSLEDGNVVDALVYFKNEENNLDAVDYSNPMNEWM